MDKLAKNSTNGFLTHEFMAWLAEHTEVNNFVIIGDCTDICIKQFALTLKAYFNENNSISRIIVPIDGTETFDLSATLHDGNLMNLMSYYEMKNKWYRNCEINYRIIKKVECRKPTFNFF